MASQIEVILAEVVYELGREGEAFAISRGLSSWTVPSGALTRWL